MNLIRLGMCPTCKGDIHVPLFAEHPTYPTCLRCSSPAPRDPVADAMEVAETYSEEETQKLALRLSANAGNYQTALLDGDATAARAFLANVVAIGEVLLRRETP